MPVVQDTLWKHPGNPGMIVVSCHASVEPDGRLYMGYGEAQEAIKRIPDIEVECAEAVQTSAVDGVYGFLPVRPFRPENKVIGFGLFQTRMRWDEPADPELIRYSMECLRNFTESNSELKIRMDFPGVGNGGLEVEKVAPLLLPLPNQVTVCHQGEVRTSIPANFPGFKTLYIQVERMLQEGRYNQAVEHLMSNGYDIQSAMDQVNAVQRLLRERTEMEAERLHKWRRAHTSYVAGGK